MNRDDEESLGFFAEFAVSRVRFFPLTELALSITRSFRSAQDDMEGRAQNDKGMLLNNLQAVPQLREARQPETEPEII